MSEFPSDYCVVQFGTSTTYITSHTRAEIEAWYNLRGLTSSLVFDSLLGERVTIARNSVVALWDSTPATRDAMRAADRMHKAELPIDMSDL